MTFPGVFLYFLKKKKKKIQHCKYIKLIIFFIDHFNKSRSTFKKWMYFRFINKCQADIPMRASYKIFLIGFSQLAKPKVKLTGYDFA